MEKYGITYTKCGDFYFPNIYLSEPLAEMFKPLGKYGMLRKKHLKEHRAITYNTMLLKETLYPHLRDVDQIARERYRRGVSEEIILSEIVYE